ncbi:hypothetical protein PFISCL1PPCAC_12071 [Pristionchus fissidentatus]|uniref:Cytochrome P450 n=1 Tax=Pristionchus fissidentatus TaxID=1538716 RepID=A0AAV5VQZ9_9BILA|nr:hypothetical protein PFISCL1PPCAC_12071 [Pristionchus fissidentatus]
MIVIILPLLLLLAVYIYKYYENVRRYPKGPMPYPLIGNLGQFDAHRLHIYFEECQSKYGDVFTVWTPCPMVVLMSYSTIKEALVTKGDDLVGRMGRYPDDLFMTTENGGVIFSQGDNWREQRRTAIQIMRDFGMGKNVMEAQVKASMHECMKHLDSIKDKSRVDFRWPLQILVANVINEVMYGFHYTYDDCKRLMTLSDGLANMMETMRKNIMVFVVMQFPSLAEFPWIGWNGKGQYKVAVNKMHDHIREDVARCEKTFDDHSEPDCFVHAYMQRMKKNNTYLNEKQMVNVCSDFFLAGMETTSTTLRWAMLLMAKNLHVQDKIRAEIHSVLGKTGEVAMSDRPRLPYTAAAVTELQRVANILPMNVIHRTVNDTKVDGHSIPNDTLVMAQIHNVMKRGEIFEDADQFKPERFLMEDGKTPNKETLEHVIPFSMGKRMCAGEGLARMELFLGLAMILQKYRILPPKEGALDLSPIEGTIFLPKTNLLQMIPV